MGYTTSFTGEITIDPPLAPEQVERLNKFCNERHGESGHPGVWCDLSFSADGTKFGWNGSEKTYVLDAWVQYLIRDYLQPWGVVANGELFAQGEEAGDVWKLVVKDNVVTRQAGRVVFE